VHDPWRTPESLSIGMRKSLQLTGNGQNRNRNRKVTVRLNPNRKFPDRQRPGHQRSITQIVLTAAVVSMAITKWRVSAAGLASMSRGAGLVPLDSSLPHHLSATDSVLTGSMRQRLNWIAGPKSPPLRIPATTNLPHVALAYQGLGVNLRRGYMEISRNATAINDQSNVRGPPSLAR
jgi:hypothetical protein